MLCVTICQLFCLFGGLFGMFRVRSEAKEPKYSDQASIVISQVARTSFHGNFHILSVQFLYLFVLLFFFFMVELTEWMCHVSSHLCPIYSPMIVYQFYQFDDLIRWDVIDADCTNTAHKCDWFNITTKSKSHSILSYPVQVLLMEIPLLFTKEEPSTFEWLRCDWLRLTNKVDSFLESDKLTFATTEDILSIFTCIFENAPKIPSVNLNENKNMANFGCKISVGVFFGRKRNVSVNRCCQYRHKPLK